MTKKNPVLDELHAVREKLLAESGGTLEGLVARLQAEQETSGRTILRTPRPARRTPTEESGESPVDDVASPPSER